MSELSPNLDRGIYSASGLQIFERLIQFFNDMLHHLMNNEFFMIFMVGLLIILTFNLIITLRKSLV